MELDTDPELCMRLCLHYNESRRDNGIYLFKPFKRNQQHIAFQRFLKGKSLKQKYILRLSNDVGGL